MTTEQRLNYLFQLLGSTARSGYVHPGAIIAEIVKELDLNPAQIMIANEQESA